MKKKYPISSYNKYVCLKVDALMIGITVYLLKPYLLGIASLANRNDRSAIIEMFYPNKMIVSSEAIAAIPIFVLVFAWSRRSPSASQKVRDIWRNGKKFILVTAFFQLLVTTSPLWFLFEVNLSINGWVQALLCVLIIIVTYRSAYMSDCFADFPGPEKVAK